MTTYEPAPGASKRYGEVLTPEPLAEEMLDTLPPEVWANPNLKWLDLCTGPGVFIKCILKRLKVHHTEQHILSNMIYACELQEHLVALYKETFDPQDKIELNIYHGSFLDKGFDKHMKEVNGVEKFDIIVGNPPYNDGSNKNKTHPLWARFVEKSFPNLISGGILLQVTPPTWASYNNKVRKVIFNRQLVTANFGSPVFKLFNASSSFSYFMCVNKASAAGFNTHVVMQDGSTMEYCFYGKDVFIFKGKGSSIARMLLDSMPKIEVLGVGKPFRSDTLSNIAASKDLQHQNILFHTNKVNLFSRLKHPHQGKHKVIINKTGTWNPFYDYSNAYTHLNFCIVSKDAKESSNIEAYLNSKLIRFYIQQLNVFGARDKFTIEKIPSIDFNRGWSDEELYKHFKLTEEEIQLVEESTK